MHSFSLSIMKKCPRRPKCELKYMTFYNALMGFFLPSPFPSLRLFLLLMPLTTGYTMVYIMEITVNFFMLKKVFTNSETLSLTIYEYSILPSHISFSVSSNSNHNSTHYAQCNLIRRFSSNLLNIHRKLFHNALRFMSYLKFCLHHNFSFRNLFPRV